MKIQYASDLHLEFTPNFNLVKSIPFEAVGDVLVLAGDIGYLHERKTYETRFWKWASEHYKQVLIVHNTGIDAPRLTMLFPTQYDVGVDNNNFTPVSFYQVKAIIEKQIEEFEKV